MVTIDLITGFLGSGKTTFIKKYAQYLLNQGLRIGILENDFGAINVDMLLLKELAGENCELEMIAGGCDRDCHARRFKTKLIAMGMCGYDRVIVEPSGIYDVDEFFDALREEPLDAWYRIGNVITVVDAGLPENLSAGSDYLLASEAANAGAVLLSHADEVTPEQMEKTVAHVNRALSAIRCKRQLKDEILTGNLMTLSEETLKKISTCGYVTESYEKQDIGDHEGFDSIYFMELPITADAAKEAAKNLLSSKEYGSVFRVKGFVKDSDGWLQLNATHAGISMDPIETGQEVLIVIGEDLQEEKIRLLLDAADRDA